MGMRIAYITNARFPNERAHGHQIQAVVQSMKELGHNVTIFAPYRNETKNVQRSDIRYLGSYDFIHSVFFPGVLGLWMLNRMMRKLLKGNLGSFDMLYTRSPALLEPLIASRKPVILELHTIPNHWRSSFIALCHHCTKIVCLTSLMKKEMIKMGIPEDLLMVEGDAIDEALLQSTILQEQARAHFQISHDVFVLGYAGSLITMNLSKGVEQILDALPEKCMALIAGGPESAAKELRSRSASAKVLGQVSHDDAIRALLASDVLVYPAPKTNHPYFLRDTSPLKLFEYMAMKKPIICADIPPVHDILDASTARFYQPGNIDELREQIIWVKEHAEEARMMAAKAFESVQDHTWKKRTMRILSSL